MYKERKKKIYEVFLKCFQEIVLYRRLKVKSRENVKKYPPAPRTKQNKIAEINRTPLVTSVYSIHHCLNTTFALIGYFLLNYVTLYHVSDLDWTRRLWQGTTDDYVDILCFSEQKCSFMYWRDLKFLKILHIHIYEKNICWI